MGFQSANYHHESHEEHEVENNLLSFPICLSVLRVLARSVVKQKSFFRLELDSRTFENSGPIGLYLSNASPAALTFDTALAAESCRKTVNGPAVAGFFHGRAHDCFAVGSHVH